jgi:hypothetical protein
MSHVAQATRHAELEAIDRILADHGGDAAKADFGRRASLAALGNAHSSLFLVHDILYGHQQGKDMPSACNRPGATAP